MIIVDQLGTFDVENAGDLLYPLLLARLLEGRGVRVRRWSPSGGPAPLRAGFASAPARRLFAARRRLVVGGGDLLRVDVDVLAGHYHGQARRDPRVLARMLGAGGALRHAVVGRLRRRGFEDFIARFRARNLSYAAPAPFVVDPEALPPGSAVSYLSCGVPHELADPRVARALDGARYLWLRDAGSRERLRRAGVTAPMHVAPDLGVLLAELWPDARRRGRALLAEAGVDVTRPVLGFQTAPAREAEGEIVDRLRAHQRETGAEIALLPIGRCHGDDDTARWLRARSGGRFHLVSLEPVRDVVAAIAGCDRFVGTSLHGNVAAFAYGIPHLFGPLSVDKNDGFLEVVGAPREQRLPSWSELDERLRWVTRPDPGAHARLEVARARAHGALEALMAAVAG